MPTVAMLRLRMVSGTGRTASFEVESGSVG